MGRVKEGISALCLVRMPGSRATHVWCGAGWPGTYIPTWGDMWIHCWNVNIVGNECVCPHVRRCVYLVYTD